MPQSGNWFLNDHVVLFFYNFGLNFFLFSPTSVCLCLRGVKTIFKRAIKISPSLNAKQFTTPIYRVFLKKGENERENKERERGGGEIDRDR
jgi:hypothetical protein